jgi:hypothetical protein
MHAKQVTDANRFEGMDVRMESNRPKMRRGEQQTQLRVNTLARSRNHVQNRAIVKVTYNSLCKDIGRDKRKA